MKQKGAFLMALVIIMLFTACSQPVGTSEHAAETASAANTQAPSAAETSEKPIVLTLTRPRIKNDEYGYVQTEYINETEFYPESKAKHRSDIFHIAKEPVSIRIEKENGISTYWIDNEPYICIGKEPTNPHTETWLDKSYQWTYDRRFFYKYANTSYGKLYRNQNTDSLEALILEVLGEWQYLLIRTDSPLASAETMSIDDFGLLIIEGVLFARAKDFEVLFYANTRGVDQETVFPTDESENVFELYGKMYGMALTFECTRIPGLRYTIHADSSDDNMKTYVDSRAENGCVTIYGPTILPIDELGEALEREYGVKQ